MADNVRPSLQSSARFIMPDTRIALVTARAARGTDYDMPLLLAALRNAGADAEEVDWDDDEIDWSRFDLALLRSTWDYCERLPAFLEWAERVSARAKLLNPLPVVRWNADKHYLGELAHAGVPVVPSRFVEPGDDAAAAVDAALAAHRDTRDVVVKPAVGAGSRDAQRHAREHSDAIIAHVRRLLDANRSVVLQPYLERVDEHGETALLFFDGAFSHSIRKGPLLRRGEGPTAGLFAEETITPREPSAEELAVAERALAAIPFDPPLLYARIDLIHDDDGAPRLLELELVEPSVFAEHAEGAAERFTQAILRRTPAG
jgi:O-ureido-D-serine cyclo-ligase